MVQPSVIDAQMKALGLKFRFFGRAEMRELSHVLNHNEIIRHCAYGYYQGGSALLIATDSRLLLIDKRPFFLNMEDLRYEMINDVYYAGRMIDARIELYTGNKKLSFRSFAQDRIRNMCGFVQNQITRARQTEHMMEQHKFMEQASWDNRPVIPRPRIGKYTTATSVVKPKYWIQ